MNSKTSYLSYLLDFQTPTYGNRNEFVCEKMSSISKGDVANDTMIHTTVHIGTHIDMPYHFFENGQTIENFDVDFFQFNNVLFLHIEPLDTIIEDDLINTLKDIDNKDIYDMVVVKTSICHIREKKEFWEKNYGFHPKIAHYLREHFPNVKVFGFDSISVSSFSNRMLGRKSHKAFLDPEHPILLLEDMDLTTLNKDSKIHKLIIAPLRIAKCDGLPCTIIAEIS